MAKSRNHTILDLSISEVGVNPQIKDKTCCGKVECTLLYDLGLSSHITELCEYLILQTRRQRPREFGGPDQWLQNEWEGGVCRIQPSSLFPTVSLFHWVNMPISLSTPCLVWLLSYFSGLFNLVFEKIWIIRGSSFITTHQNFNKLFRCCCNSCI